MSATPLNFPIASLEADRTGGRIGMSFCPGRPPHSPLGNIYARLLAHDIGTVARWGARAMVTLLETEELLELGLQDLGERVRSLGIDWHFLPLPREGGLSPSFEQRWEAPATELEEVLRHRGRVFIHCRDGVCRTGFVAARLLVDLGCRPEDAINRVRGARPGAIENPEQQRNILAARDAAFGQPNRIPLDRLRLQQATDAASRAAPWAVPMPARPKPAFSGPQATYIRGGPQLDGGGHGLGKS